jgi:hypothetical protein
MTTIAYTNGIMASDSSWVGNDEIQDTSLTKIVRLTSGALWGGAGDADDRELVALLQHVKKPAQLPTKRQLHELRMDGVGLIVFPNGDVWKIEIGEKPEGCGVWPCNRGYAAVGSGAHLAIGYMGKGGSARDAVAFACRFDPYSRLPVHYLPLKKGEKPRKKAA